MTIRLLSSHPLKVVQLNSGKISKLGEYLRDYNKSRRLTDTIKLPDESDLTLMCGKYKNTDNQK